MKPLEHCYDFPEIVLHRSDMICGRYSVGGVCRPLPTPVEPYTDDEQAAVDAHREIIRSIESGSIHMNYKRIEPLGTTLPPDQAVHHD